MLLALLLPEGFQQSGVQLMDPADPGLGEIFLYS